MKTLSVYFSMPICAIVLTSTLALLIHGKLDVFGLGATVFALISIILCRIGAERWDD